MPAHYDSETIAQHFAQISERFGRIEEQLARVSAHLGIPYVEPSAGVPPEVLEQVRAGNQMEAIKLYRAAASVSFEEAQRVVAGL